MRPSLLGRVLVAVGGLLVVAGAMRPEVEVAVARVVAPSTPRATPDRSHWVVIRENLDMLEDPDDSLDAWNYDYWRAEAAGLAYLPAVGVLLALSAAFARSRVAAAALALLHAGAWLLLGGLAFTVWRVVPGAAGIRRWGLPAAAVFAALALAEAVALRRVLRPARRGRLLPPDVASLLPAAVLLLLGAALYATLHDNPHWPGDGYAWIAVGALGVLGGQRLRRDPRAPTGSACPSGAAVGPSVERPSVPP